MKRGWQRRQIGDLCDVIAGQSPEGKFYNTEGKGMPFYQGKKDFGEKFIEAPTTWTTRATKMARKGDILISVRAPVGPVNLATHEACIGRGLAAIRGRADVNRDFLFYQLLHLQPEIAGKEGAVFASISKSAIEALPIAFAALREQHRIVGILDAAFEGIATSKANTEKNLQNARAVFESHLDSVFIQRDERWAERRFGDSASFRNGINFTKSSQGAPVKIVGVKDFGDRFWAPLDDLESVTPDGVLPDSDILKENDLLFVRSNGNMELIGRCLLVGAVNGKVTHSGFTIRARLTDRSVKPKFLCYYLKSSKVRRELIDGGIGTNIKSLNQTKLSALVIPIPTEAEQARIVHSLDAMNADTRRLESIYRRKLAALDALKKSILHQAFSDQL